MSVRYNIEKLDEQYFRVKCLDYPNSASLFYFHYDTGKSPRKELLYYSGDKGGYFCNINTKGLGNIKCKIEYKIINKEKEIFESHYTEEFKFDPRKLKDGEIINV